MCKGCYSGSSMSYMIPSTSSYSSSHSSGGYMSGSSSTSYTLHNSELEAILPSSEPLALFQKYNKPAQQGDYMQRSEVSRSYVHMPDVFLNPLREPTKFIGKAKDIEEHVREAFNSLTGKELPSNIVINVCGEEEMKKAHPNWNENIRGFALNRKQGMKEVFVKEDNLDRIMITIGHELGHVMSDTLLTAQDEEAKAFAFELAWMNTIHEHNIAELANSINQDILLRPANNGIHNVAFEFVRKMVMEGKNAMEIFLQLIEGSIRVRWW